MTVTEVLEELNVEIAPEGHHHVSEGWVGIDCPFCSPGTGSFRLGIPPDTKGSVSCWACGPHRLWETLSEASGRPIRDVGALCQGLRGDRPAERILERRGRLVVPFDTGKLQGPHRKYLESRRLDPTELSRLWGLQGIGPMGGRHAHRIFIPIRKETETVSFTTRSILKKTKLRYLTAKPSEEKISSRELLYGMELARSTIVVVEGPVDVWTLGPGAVACLGVGWSPTQLRLIASFPVRAICFDSEPEGRKRARKLLRELEAFDGDTYDIRLEHGKDPNECLRTTKGRREVRRLQRALSTGTW